MNDQNRQPIEENVTDWHKITRKGVLIGKFFLLLFILCLFATLTYQYIISPYSLFIIGIEICLMAISAFSLIRMNTFKPVKPYDFDKLKNQNEPLKFLLTNIDYDIKRYEEGSSYYFHGVRFYKYSTIILAGISTIILGLDLGDIGDIYVIDKMKYTIFAKNIALIIGAIITVSTALMTYWNIEKYWLMNKTIVNKLKALRGDIETEYLANKLADPTKLKEKVDEFKKIKGDFYKYWEGALADRGSQGGSSAGK